VYLLLIIIATTIRITTITTKVPTIGATIAGTGGPK
jgi:hypothetical protein